jgi:hypothetical protein
LKSKFIAILTAALLLSAAANIFIITRERSEAPKYLPEARNGESIVYLGAPGGSGPQSAEISPRALTRSKQTYVIPASGEMPYFSFLVSNEAQAPITVKVLMDDPSDASKIWQIDGETSAEVPGGSSRVFSNYAEEAPAPHNYYVSLSCVAEEADGSAFSSARMAGSVSALVGVSASAVSSYGAPSESGVCLSCEQGAYDAALERSRREDGSLRAGASVVNIAHDWLLRSSETAEGQNIALPDSRRDKEKITITPGGAFTHFRAGREDSGVYYTQDGFIYLTYEGGGAAADCELTGGKLRYPVFGADGGLAYEFYAQ